MQVLPKLKLKPSGSGEVGSSSRRWGWHEGLAGACERDQCMIHAVDHQTLNQPTLILLFPSRIHLAHTAIVACSARLDFASS